MVNGVESVLDVCKITDEKEDGCLEGDRMEWRHPNNYGPNLDSNMRLD